jgi:hypothetical protein
MDEVGEEPVRALHELVCQRLRYEVVCLYDELLGVRQLVTMEQRLAVPVLVRLDERGAGVLPHALEELASRLVFLIVLAKSPAGLHLRLFGSENRRQERPRKTVLRRFLLPSKDPDGVGRVLDGRPGENER